jgi:hypothetical protein
MRKTKIKTRSSEQNRINSALTKRKKYLIDNEPDCIFCNKFVGRYGELAHKVRRSWASKYRTRFELHTMDLNNGLGHHVCHQIFDDNPNEAKKLSNYSKILADIKVIDPDYYQKMINK